MNSIEKYSMNFSEKKENLTKKTDANMTFGQSEAWTAGHVGR
jgi:hypothetical protein